MSANARHGNLKADHVSLDPPAPLSSRDHLDLNQLFARYMWTYNSKDVDGWVRLFCSEGVLTDGKFVVKGKEELKDAIKMFLELHGSEPWYHYNSQIIPRGSSGSSIVFSYWASAMTTSINHVLHGAGTYETHCIKEEGRWLIKLRNFIAGPPAQTLL